MQQLSGSTQVTIAVPKRKNDPRLPGLVKGFSSYLEFLLQLF